MKHTKVVADYMMTEHESGHVFDATNMQGYRYIFHGEDLTLPYLSKPDYRTALAACAFTTVDTVWQWIDSQSVSVFSREHGGILKDIALSFTLFKLLKRRFGKYDHGEAGRPKTRTLIVSGLLREEAGYSRAFRVIEMELTFLYDFFYTRHQSHTQYVGMTVVFVLPVIVWNAISGAFSRHYHRTSLEQTVNGTDVIHCITIVLMVVVVVVLVVESRINDQKWRVVDDLHTLTGASKITWKGEAVPFDDGSRKQAMKGIKKRKHRKLTGRNWDRKLGQYSLLHSFDYHPRNVASILSLGLIEPTRDGQKASKKVELPEEVVMHVRPVAVQGERRPPSRWARSSRRRRERREPAHLGVRVAHECPHGPRVAHRDDHLRHDDAAAADRRPPRGQVHVGVLRLPGGVRSGHAAGARLRHEAYLQRRGHGGSGLPRRV